MTVRTSQAAGCCRQLTGLGPGPGKGGRRPVLPACSLRHSLAPDCAAKGYPGVMDLDDTVHQLQAALHLLQPCKTPEHSGRGPRAFRGAEFSWPVREDTTQ